MIADYKTHHPYLGQFQVTLRSLTKSVASFSPDRL
jgi:hypothetical protein